MPKIGQTPTVEIVQGGTEGIVHPTVGILGIDPAEGILNVDTTVGI